MDINQPTDEEMLARVLHRDGLMLVIDKPAGIPVHKGPKGGPNLEASFDALRFGLPRPPVLAHRLDKETSGCLVLGRHRKATASLGLLFKHGKISKTYWAVVEGGPEADEGVIELPLGKLNAERGWWQKPDPSGQPAVTKWRVLGRSYAVAAADPSPSSPPTCGTTSPPPCGEGSGVGVPTGIAARSHPPPRPSPARGEGADRATGESAASSGKAPKLTWLAMEPITGRTHQLRVHSAASGWPIIGDNIYGNGPRFGEPRLHLHAREISIPLSKNKPPVQVVAPAPLHMHERLRLCGWNGE
ncbi:putative RNA pseudouridine synthase (Uracil hydrolyase) [Bradyrhizobium sp. ORS 278]|uniref:RluA family pseudouridine synthase n=1 Tax=Bradyrhizobium sp. (strain ORS 278) TaxID=114615 RepID=UPI0001507EBD|nr:RNA pseudouridine synthase [Bradyrhizobium sp. ORS 278]CAL74333.1 putative RNA pseudouridine synthase (Uracil hydrolyase) [Bradyrhizobium sp. ORS 278]